MTKYIVFSLLGMIMLVKPSENLISFEAAKSFPFYKLEINGNKMITKVRDAQGVMHHRILDNKDNSELYAVWRKSKNYYLIVEKGQQIRQQSSWQKVLVYQAYTTADLHNPRSLWKPLSIKAEDYFITQQAAFMAALQNTDKLKICSSSATYDNLRYELLKAWESDK